MSRHSLFFAIVLAVSISLFITCIPLPMAAQGSGGSTGYDGPAQLPNVTVVSSVAATPAPGATITIAAGDDLQSGLDRAHCGDTVQLQAGATFTGSFRLPALSCDDGHWIVIRTSAPDSALPPEGQRLTPCYAGVASLPGRPAYACDHPQNVLAQLVGAPASALILRSGANHYRLVGLEITRPAGIKGARILIDVEKGGTADHIVLDRSWLHGTIQDDTKGGFQLSGTHYVAIVDSYFSDFHCTSKTGSCTEAHAVSGGTGDFADGLYKIEDNFLESSGQAILFGGGAATTTPADITIRFNHFFKPWLWMRGSTPYQGGDSDNPFIVRHHLELKNAVRVLIENNLMENVWGGFNETGDAILLTPKNQHTKSGTNVCPLCAVTDVTIRYTHVFHASGGIVIATDISGNGHGGGEAAAGTRFSIHDVVLDDINRKYLGGGNLFVITNSWSANPVNTITIDHITGFPDSDGGIVSLGDRIPNPAMYGLVFTNSIVTTGRYPVRSVGGGVVNCAHSGTPAQRLAACFTTYAFSNNALVAAPSHYPPSSFPPGNLFAVNENGVAFIQCEDGNGGDYELLPESPFKNKGTDGRDLGADIVGIKQALANVE